MHFAGNSKRQLRQHSSATEPADDVVGRARVWEKKELNRDVAWRSYRLAKI